jgi:signal peptidase I
VSEVRPPDRLFPELPDEQLALRPRPRYRPVVLPRISEEDGAVEQAEAPRPPSFAREFPILLGVALILAFLLRTFVVQVFYIPSSSMVPTLLIDDRIVVEKVTYLRREPARGEIIVFEGDEPLVAEVAGPATRVVRGVGRFLGVVPMDARDFVKRVVGLPGDEVEVRGGIVRINGVALAEPYVVNRDDADFGPVTVPPGTLFFLGDNRPNSADSRGPLGFVDREQVVGRAALVIWPLSRLDVVDRPTYDSAVD